jgi:ABC-2 type transport system permease protein
VADALLVNLRDQTELDPLIERYRARFVRDIYTRAQALLDQRPAAVQYTSTTGAAVNVSGDGFGQSVPGMGSMYVMFTVLGGMAVLLRERNQWTLQRLVVLPVSRAQILGGKVLTYCVLGMIQFLIVFAVGLLVGLDFGNNPAALLAVMLAFVLCCTAIAFAIAPRVSSEEQANGIARLLALTLAPLGGAWWPLEIVPDFMRRVAYLSPVSWAMDAFHNVMYYGGTLLDVLPNVGVLLVVTVVLFVVGVRSFRYA